MSHPSSHHDPTAPTTPRLKTALVGALILVLAMAAGAYKLMTTPSFQLFGGLTKRVDTPRKVVALTFDDGPTCGDVDAVLRALDGTPATFFVLGSETERCPDGARRLVAAGAELGNHTWNHRRMVLVGPATVAAEVEPTDAALRAAGQRGEILFRPPYGKKLVVLPWWLHQHDRRTIMWDVGVETFDGPGQDAATIARETVARTRPGSIILLHPWNGRTTTQQAIGSVIAELRAQGYAFVTVSELLRQ